MFAQGRTAFYYGLKKLQLKKNKIFIPNYICKSLLVPILKSKICYKFYNINDSFEINLKTIEKQISKNDYLLIVHYFGQPQNFDLVLNFCNKYKIRLIEDNAHGHSGKFKGKDLGTFGEMSFSSPRKILNSSTGGVLIYKKKKISSNLKKNYLLNFIFLKNFFKKFIICTYLKNRFYNQSSFYFNRIKKLESYFLNYSADANSVTEIKNTDWQRIRNTRIKRWIKVVKFFKKKRCKPVWTSPSVDTCPWLVPFYVKNKVYRDKIIKWGVNHGIKIITWPNLPEFNSKKDYTICRLRWEKLFCVELDDSIDNFFLNFNH
jgi:hypothetical protein